MADPIKMVGLTKTFGHNIAVDGLSLIIREGEIFGLVGPDGAGKTTIMRLLAGVLEPTAGNAWVAGCHTIKDSNALSRHISYMPQRFGLYLDLTVQENIDFYADLYNVSKKIRQEKIPELLAFSNMAPFKNRQAGKLSGGMKQKLALACALVHTPQVLLLDEPTNGVDPLSRRDFWRILYKLLEEKVTIFMSTAYLDEAERCNRVGFLHEGKLVAVGTPDEMKLKMPGTVIEVRSKNTRQLMAELVRILQPLSAGLFGTKIHLVLPEKSLEALQRVECALALFDKDGESEAIVPSLEDVFISLLVVPPREGFPGNEYF